MPADNQPLTQLATGTVATVAAIGLSGEDNRRIQELGLVVGTTVEVVRFGPLGGQIEIKVRHSRLSLPKHEAEQIYVCPKAAA